MCPFAPCNSYKLSVLPVHAATVTTIENFNLLPLFNNAALKASPRTYKPTIVTDPIQELPVAVLEDYY